MFIKENLMKHNPVCPYCGKLTDLVSGDVIYKKRPDLKELNFYLCEACDAYVGTHKGTQKPLGSPANKELREWRSLAHFYFDDQWKSGKVSRSCAYHELASKMGISKPDCHIAMFNIEQCKQVVKMYGMMWVESFYY